MKRLSDNFIHELYKICLKNSSVLKWAIDKIEYTYLPNEQYKEVWKFIKDYYTATDKAPSIGIIAQNFLDHTGSKSDQKFASLISEIKTAQQISEKEAFEQLSVFLQNKYFIETYGKLGELFNKGKKEKVLELLKETSEGFQKFKLNQVDSHNRVLAGLVNRVTTREQTRDLSTEFARKIPTGIVPFDQQTRGGIDRGDTLLLMAPSGVGKSKALKHMGLSAARMGFVVVHIQAEGTKEEAEIAYEAAVLGRSVTSVEYNGFSYAERQKVEQAIDHITSSMGGEIFMKAYEQFDTATMRDVRDYCQQVYESEGRIDLLVLDYLDEMDPGDGKMYSTSNDGERKRREANAKKFKNICVEFKCAGVTATQSNTRPPSEINDPEFVLTRYHISEFKGIIKPFSYFLTLNRTADEAQNNVMRIYIDKMRKYRPIAPVIKLATNFNVERFYWHQKTIELFGEQVGLAS